MLWSTFQMLLVLLFENNEVMGPHDNFVLSGLHESSWWPCMVLFYLQLLNIF